MKFSLKLFGLSLVAIAFLLTVIGINIPFFTYVGSLWTVKRFYQEQDICRVSMTTMTAKGDKCLFPFYDGDQNLRFDCIPYGQTTVKLWCASSCNSTGMYMKFTTCSMTRLNSPSGPEEINNIDTEKSRYSISTQVLLMTSLISLITCFTIGILEYFLLNVLQRRALETITIFFIILSILTNLGGLIFVGSAVRDTVTVLREGFWIVFASLVLTVVAVIIYIVGVSKDHENRNVLKVLPYDIYPRGYVHGN